MVSICRREDLSPSGTPEECVVYACVEYVIYSHTPNVHMTSPEL